MKLGWQGKKVAEKESQAGFRGYPVATFTFYGPDNRRASKAIAEIIAAPDSEPVYLCRWFDESHDVRSDSTTSRLLKNLEIEAFSFVFGREVDAAFDRLLRF